MVPSSSGAETLDWPDSEAIPRFIAEMVDRHAFDASELQPLFSALKPNAAVLRAIAPPTDPGIRSWQRYRARFLDRDRIDNGIRFWIRHRQTIERAASTFGVPPEIIVAIIGVETEYGRNKGNFRVIDALGTIAFAYPPRAEYFRSELEQFLLLSRENRLAPEAVRGSYAGAIGIPQFMPGSQRRFAIDFDQDGRIDLMNSPEDAIGSVARFLAMHGWEAGQAIAEHLRESPPAAATLLAAGTRPSLDRPALHEAGVAEKHLPKSFPVSLIELDTPGAESEYRWGHHNFFVITRYNRSNFYAASVVDLASAIADRRKHDPANTNLPIQATKKGSRAKRRPAG